MSNIKIVVFILATVISVFLLMCIVIPYLIKKGLNLSGIINGAETALDTADIVLDGLQACIPDNPGFKIVDIIIDYAKQSVKAAEQMYKASQIDAEERKNEARKLVKEFLIVSGVELTDDIEKIIEGAIEAAVFVLPKTNPVYAEEKES